MVTKIRNKTINALTVSNVVEIVVVFYTIRFVKNVAVVMMTPKLKQWTVKIKAKTEEMKAQH